ncbi:hypothetical protein A2U01_0030726, partial [Trifolium medium]|nr:hypothetical protein [Trifolium medium]
GSVNEFVCNGVEAATNVFGSRSGVCAAAKESMEVGSGASENFGLVKREGMRS